MDGQWLRFCKSRRAKVTLALLAGCNLAILAWTLQPMAVNHTNTYDYKLLRGNSQKSELPKCPDILSEMARGRWITRNLTKKEQSTINIYLTKERGAFRIPSTFQRADGRCGDLPYEHSPLYNIMWFKAICNPKGSTPCCFENKCTSRSEEQCRCLKCYDERQTIHAEYAKWKTHNEACNVGNYSTAQACQLLQDANIVFVGDSFIRHLFAATAIVLTGNRVDGALRRLIQPYSRNICLGMHQITGLTCRELLDEDRLLCNGTVRIRYTQVFPSTDLPKSVKHLTFLHQHRKSLIVMGMGIHDDFDVFKVMKVFLLPFMNIHQWVNMHPDKVKEIAQSVVSYSAALSREKPMTGYNLPAMETMLKDLGFNKSYLKELTKNVDLFPSTVEGNNLLPVPGNGNSTLLLNNPFPTHKPVKSSPQLLWIGTHAPGLLKSPKFIRQTYNGVKMYNDKAFDLLTTWGVPHLDTLSFSNGTVSFDGTHYGWGINMLKVNMLLTYIEKKLKTGHWKS